MPTRRMIIIGLDGADKYILDKLFARGLCSNIARLSRDGCFGRILSTVPPLTPPAWTSMLTGLNPGRHGIFDFIQSTDDGRFVVVNATRRSGATLFDYCIAQRCEVIDLFVPFTFPPPDDGGIHISGLGTPSSESDFIRPHSIRDKMLTEYPRLKDIDICAGQNLDTLGDALLDEVKMKSDIANELMDTSDWGLAMVVFNATDLAQHFYLKYFDDGHPFYDASNEKYSNVIPEVYSACDKFVGECLSRAGDDGCVAIISDHGCQPLASTIAKDVLLKDILISLDLLHVVHRKDDDRPSKTAEAAHRGLHAIKKYTPHGVKHAFNVLFSGAKERMTKALETVPFGDDIDWASTKAFIGPGSYGIGIYLNLKGSFPHGNVEPGAEAEEITDRILEKLKSYKLPDGRPLVSFASRRDEIYWGEAMTLAPDIVVLFNEPSSDMGSIDLGDGLHLPPPDVRPGTDLTWTGTHSLRGVFGIWGDGIKPGLLDDKATLTDITPTILHIMNLNVPEGLDGDVIRGIRADGAGPVYSSGIGAVCTADRGLSPQEEKDIYEKLKSIGYFH